MPAEGPAATPARRVSGGLGRFLAVTVVFTASYGLFPLYSSNQNHRFLHGFARAGVGYLADDWMAGTVDPFPLFTAVVALVRRHLLPQVFYVLYAVLLGAYAVSLAGLAFAARRRPRSGAEQLLFLTALAALHNDVLGYLLLGGVDGLRRWQAFTWGFAEQEIFGHGMFQPSAFGLLLVTSLCLHERGWPMAASALAGAVAAVHPSYALAAAGLATGYAWTVAREKRRAGPAAATLLLALAVALPTLVYVSRALAPTSEETSVAAATILARHIPQEADPEQWLGAKMALQVAWMGVGLWLARRARVFPALLAVFGGGALLTAAQLASGDPRLALGFPWRVSVLLVPVASAFAVSALADRIAPALGEERSRRLATKAATAVLALLVVASGVRMLLNFTYFHDWRAVRRVTDSLVPRRWQEDFERDLHFRSVPMMGRLRETGARGETYLIPPELERFRLETGLPVYVDRKSHPYRDREVIEWHGRLERARSFYSREPDCAALGSVPGSVTHVVLARPVGATGSCAAAEQVYADEAYVVYRLAGRGAGS